MANFITISQGKYNISNKKDVHTLVLVLHIPTTTIL